MHFSSLSRVSAVLEFSRVTYTLRFSVRHFLAHTRKSLFLKRPLQSFLGYLFLGT